jgi:hypothetical protein
MDHYQILAVNVQLLNHLQRQIQIHHPHHHQHQEHHRQAVAIVVEEELIAVVGEVVVAAEEDLVHLNQLGGVDANEDIESIANVI